MDLTNEKYEARKLSVLCLFYGIFFSALNDLDLEAYVPQETVASWWRSRLTKTYRRNFYQKAVNTAHVSPDQTSM